MKIFAILFISLAYLQNNKIIRDLASVENFAN